ncbi:hypothetical protein RSOLAG1IB_07309 [Rhizoctonia solani AG-1 IB]|uniref:Ricin B lectin domain-containing protein n=2 Tax=Rhizoctonia solani TaxID=456999 RepID=M5CD60_THACB|nr:unnamed protein product [Rhizoctonia solani]CCO37055.1 hypothetical protein BN14_11206 [Rhizoctonia solani AG-1 IB]CEL54775.1 hypothetical protein RSOLAG1IB_07309 [Rhizoctonia solani AG-1 IB]
MSVQPGVYRIKNVETGKYIVLTSGANNTTITGAAAAAGDKKALWRVVSSGGKFKLKNLEFNKECNISETIYAFGSDSGYEWNIESTGSGSHFIDTGIEGVILELDKASNKVQMSPSNGSKNQHWIFETAPDPNQSSGGGNTGGGDGGDTGDANYQPRPDAYHIPEGTYVIRNLKARTVVDLERSTGGENVRVFGYQENGGANQKWQIKPSGKAPAVSILCVATSKYAAFPDFKANTTLRSSSQPQEFFIIPADKGAFYIVPINKQGYVWNLTGGSSTNETEIRTVHNYGVDEQKWLFERV